MDAFRLGGSDMLLLLLLGELAGFVALLADGLDQGLLQTERKPVKLTFFHEVNEELLGAVGPGEIFGHVELFGNAADDGGMGEAVL